MVRFLHEVVACVGRIGVQAYLSRISYGLMEAGKCHHRGDHSSLSYDDGVVEGKKAL